MVTSGTPSHLPYVWAALSAWLARSCWLGAGSLQAGPACVAAVLSEVSAAVEVKPSLSALTSGRRCMELSKRCGVCSSEPAAGCGARTGLWLGWSPGEAAALVPGSIVSRSPAQGSHRRPVRCGSSNSRQIWREAWTFSSELSVCLGAVLSTAAFLSG